VEKLGSKIVGDTEKALIITPLIVVEISRSRIGSIVCLYDIYKLLVEENCGKDNTRLSESN
jgi:hypothetical protein